MGTGLLQGIVDRLRAYRSTYFGLSKAKRATIWITVCSFLQRAISFIAVPIFTRLLSAAEYGELSVYTSWQLVAMYVITLGVIYGGFNNGMMRYREDREGYASSVMGLVLVMGTFWLLVGLALQDSLIELTGMPLAFVALMFCESIALAVQEIWTLRMRFDYEYRKLVAFSVLKMVLAPTVGIIFVLMAHDRVLARVFGFFVVEGALAAVLAVFLLRKGRKLFCIEYWKYALFFSIPLLPHYLSEVLLSAVDRIMIEDLCSAADTGIYSIAYSAGMIMMLFVNSLNSTVNPWLYRRLNAGEYHRVDRTGFVLLGLLAVAILAMDGLAPTIVAILAPGEYSDAMFLVPVIAASVFFTYLYSYCSNIEFYYEVRVPAMVASVAAAVLNVVLNAALIPVFGYIAAGYTTLACYASLGLLHFLLAQKITHERTGAKILSGGRIWLLALGLVVVSALFSLIYPVPLARYAVTTSLVAVCIWKRRLVFSKLREMTT